MLDNLSAHKAPPSHRMARRPERARWHLHFTPTSSSWLNLVERWFNELTERRLRRGVFTASPRSSRRSNRGPSTGTTTRSLSSGTSPPRRSSRRSVEDGSPPPSQIRDGPLEASSSEVNWLLKWTKRSVIVHLRRGRGRRRAHGRQPRGRRRCHTRSKRARPR